MIVYRCVSLREIANLIGIPNELNAPRGKNTFNYKRDVRYKHFFYHIDSAMLFMDFLNIDRYYDKYSLIFAYDIDDELLSNYFSLGQYNISCVPNGYKDSLLKYFNTIYLPEFAIPIEFIKNEMIVGISNMNNKDRIAPISYVGYDTLSSSINNSEKNFLEYEKWLFDNGTNVSKDLVMNNFNKLFPLNLEKKEYLKDKK
jgi:hypothetical protein